MLPSAACSATRTMPFAAALRPCRPRRQPGSATSQQEPTSGSSAPFVGVVVAYRMLLLFLQVVRHWRHPGLQEVRSRNHEYVTRCHDARAALSRGSSSSRQRFWRHCAVALPTALLQRHCGCRGGSINSAAQAAGAGELSIQQDQCFREAGGLHGVCRSAGVMAGRERGGKALSWPASAADQAPEAVVAAFPSSSAASPSWPQSRATSSRLSGHATAHMWQSQQT